MTKREYIHLKGIDFISNVNLDEEVNEGFMDLIEELDRIIASLEKTHNDLQDAICGHCKYLTIQDDGVNWCRLYKCAKPWDGYCEKWEKR